MKFWIPLIAYCLLLSAFNSARLSADELRDPFMFGPRTALVAQPKAALNGVLWDAKHPLAIIGESTVAIGDFVDNWQIIDIKEDGIIIQRGERREFLSPGNSLPQ